MKLHDKIQSLVDDPNGFSVKFMKYDFTVARRRMISEIIDGSLNHMPKSLIAVGDDDISEVFINALIQKGYQVNNESQVDIKKSIRVGMKHTTISELEFTFRFPSEVNWTPGTFGKGYNGNNDLGEAGSCFFSSKAGALKMIKNEGGVPVTVHINGINPYCRFFIMPAPDNAMITFNAYVTDQGLFGLPVLDILKLFADAIANYIGEGYKSKTIKFTNNGDYAGRLHINNAGNGVLVKVPPFPDSYNARIAEDDFYKCNVCETRLVDDEDVIRDAFDNIWCEECAEDRLDSCSFDGLLYRKSQMTVGPNGLAYFNENISKVKEFVFDADTKKFIYRKDAKEIGNNIFVHKNSNKGICKSCGSIEVLTNGYCKACKADEEFIEAVEGLGVNPFDMKWTFPDDNDKLKAFLKVLETKLIVNEK